MPMPKPKKDETQEKFMNRCMGSDVMVSEYPDEKQRYAVCMTQWEEKDSKTMTDKIERRIVPAEDVELRVVGGTPPRLTGYAARFGKDSLDLGGFIESIAPGAFANALKNCDVRALKNHDPNLILGRTPKTLGLSENSRGLKFDVELPDTSTGRDIAEEVRREDITGCSFSFTVTSDTWEWPEIGTPHRTINEVGELYDIGPVTFPAYPDTSVALRSMEQAQAARAAPPNTIVPESPAEPPSAEPPSATPELDAARKARDADKAAAAAAYAAHLQAELDARLAARAATPNLDAVRPVK